jgi:hypothetical protein
MIDRLLSFSQFLLSHPLPSSDESLQLLLEKVYSFLFIVLENYIWFLHRINGFQLDICLLSSSYDRLSDAQKEQFSDQHFNEKNDEKEKTEMMILNLFSNYFQIFGPDTERMARRFKQLRKMTSVSRKQNILLVPLGSAIPDGITFHSLFGSFAPFS